MTYTTEIIIALLSIFLSGLLSAAEMAIASFGSQKIEDMKEKGDKKAKDFEKIQKISNSFFGTIQILSVIFASSATIISYHLMFTLVKESRISVSPEASVLIAFIATLLVIIPLIMIFDVLIPKATGFRYSDILGRSTVKIILLFTKIFSPFVLLCNHLSNLILKPIKEKTNFTQTRFSEDEIRIIISEGVKSGALNSTEQKIIENVFEFNDLKANEILSPRTEMVAIDITETEEEIKETFLKTPHSILPVYEDSLDNILGIIHAKDFFKNILSENPKVIKELIKPAYFIPEYKLISDVLKEMRINKHKLAIIMDEYGGTEGFVTLEDILGEIVGDISSESNQIINKLKDGYLVLGTIGLDEFNLRFNFDLPVSSEYNTLAGFAADYTGKILNEGEEFTYQQLKFRLIKKDRQKMVQFKVYSDDFNLSEQTVTA